MDNCNLEFSRHVFGQLNGRAAFYVVLADHIGSSFQQAQGVRLKFSEQPRNDFPFFPLAAAGFADFAVAFVGCVLVRFFLRLCREG